MRAAVWGSFSASLPRYGVCRYRLVVYPPGTNASQRRRLRVWRSLPVWGPLLWLALGVLLGTLSTSSGAVVATATAITAAVAVVVRRAAGRLPGLVRSVEATSIPGYTFPAGVPTPSDVIGIHDELRSADVALARHVLNPVEHELIWQRAYNSVPPRRGVAWRRPWGFRAQSAARDPR